MKGNEIWKDIPGYEGAYQISNYGRVKSLQRTLPHKLHGIWHIKERILKVNHTGPGKNKYAGVMLHNGHGNMTSMKIHRLVAEAFIPNPEGKPQVNHKDGNTLNNHMDNLEWVTGLENVTHAWQNGLCKSIVHAKQHAVMNLDTGEMFNSIAEAERSFGKSVGAISHALNGKHACAHGYHWAYVKENKNE